MIDPDSRELLHADCFKSDFDDANRRAKHMAEQVGEALMGIDPELEVSVYTENSVMRGKGGATFQRVIGAIHSVIPYSYHLGEVQNSTVKKHVGGHGQADKRQVAQGAHDYFVGDGGRTQTPSSEAAERLLIETKWDITDAIAIAITGYELGK